MFRNLLVVNGLREFLGCVRGDGGEWSGRVLLRENLVSTEHWHEMTLSTELTRRAGSIEKLVIHTGFAHCGCACRVMLSW